MNLNSKKEIMKKERKVDKKEEKHRRISSAIANMDIGQIISPTKLFKSIQIHPDTGRDLMDLYDSLKMVGFKTIRDENGILIRIMRIDESIDMKKEIAEIRKDIIDIKVKLEEVRSLIKK
jgi:hypothetical protein